MKLRTLGLALALAIPSILPAQQSDNPNTLTAPDGSSVTITRDNYGVPHISGESEIGVFFGQGFAVAEDRLEQMDTFRRAAEGGLAEIFGTFQLESDRQAIREYYTPAERLALFNEMADPLKNAFTAYVDGVNAYIALARTDPDRYLPGYFLGAELRDWNIEATVAVTQFFMRQFGEFGGEELDRLQELQDNGDAWFEQNRPINDPSAYTTIPGGGGVAIRDVNYTGPAIQKSIVENLQNERIRISESRAEQKIPNTFGSFATVVTPDRSASGNSLLLGAPQMGAPQENTMGPVNEVEMIAPGFHILGISVSGIPGIVIGRNEFYSWTMTSGISDNSDIFIEELETEELNRYKFNGEFKDLERFETTIKVLAADDETFVHYRTGHGPIIAEDLANKQAYSIQKTFWNRELEMAEAFYDVWKGENLEQFESAVQKSPMSFNVFYTGIDQTIKFFHIGFYPDRQDDVDPRLPQMGDGSQEWEGLIPTEDLPKLENPDQGYFVNWNNKPSADWNNGDNTPWGNGTRLTTRVEEIDQYISSKNLVSFEDLIGVPVHISDTGTYQQILEWGEAATVRDENIVPPGQSGYINSSFEPSPHRNDQWDLFSNDGFKDMQFSPVKVVSNESDLPRDRDIISSYPNPFHETTTLFFGDVNLRIESVKVFDLLGREVHDLSSRTIEYSKELELGSNLLPGVYWVEIQTNEGRHVQAISKVN